METNYFSKQLQYELWANELVFKAITEASEPEERVYDLISHVVISHHIWYKKLIKEAPEYKSWDRLSLDKLKQLNLVNISLWERYFNNVYNQSKTTQLEFSFFGKPSLISVEDLFIHLINHSSYHRGQIIAKLKGKLDPLPLTTYIAFATKPM